MRYSAARRAPARGDSDVSIVRVGLAETKNFAEGYDAIFGKKGSAKAGTSAAKPKKPARARKAAAPKARGKAKAKKAKK
jgi:hypothetical protein